MPARLSFHADPSAIVEARTLLVIGRRRQLLSSTVRDHLPPRIDEAWEDMVGRSDPGDDGRASGSWTGDTPARVVAGVLPEKCSRHNTPTRAWSVPKLMATVTHGDVGILVALSDDDHLFALALAIARSLPEFHLGAGARDRKVDVVFLGTDGEPCTALDAARRGAEAVRLAARLVDAPPSELDAEGLRTEAIAVAEGLGAAVEVETIVGEALIDAGLGGIWAVGKAAETAPSLVVLDYNPEGASRHIALVGKGIVYDTGGLSIKSKTGMVGMKTDMGGAAAVLGAFQAAVALGSPHRITAALCIAENAIGPSATRPDDILRMFSGRTVEINNTDAEGRLVLADGVAWVAKHRSPDEIIDIATLTGAQSMATGKRHAAIFSDDADLEARAVRCGLATGDLTYPLPFCPEFFRREFQSQVADMRNSVKDRANGQSSCAAEFVRAHLNGHGGSWLHIDMAGPSMRGGRATGFGVALLMALVDAEGVLTVS